MNDEKPRSAPRVVACPQCAAPVQWSAQSPYRPFCSERCKMLDLGAWATERYRVPDNESSASDDSPESGAQSETHGRPS